MAGEELGWVVLIQECDKAHTLFSPLSDRCPGPGQLSLQACARLLSEEFALLAISVDQGLKGCQRTAALFDFVSNHTPIALTVPEQGKNGCLLHELVHGARVVLNERAQRQSVHTVHVGPWD